jgi:hypothetical protein
MKRELRNSTIPAIIRGCSFIFEERKTRTDTLIQSLTNFPPCFSLISLPRPSFRSILLLSFLASLNQLCMHLPSIEVTGRSQTFAFICSNRSFSSLAAFLALILPIFSYTSTTALVTRNSTSVAVFLSSFSCRSRAFVASACLSFSIRFENAVLSLGFLLGFDCAFHCFPAVNSGHDT